MSSKAPVTSVCASAYTIPTELPEADGTAEWDATSMTIVEVEALDRTGVGWTFGPAACRSIVEDLLAEVVVGRDAMALPGIWETMRRSIRNATRSGSAGYAMSAVDVALWDLKAKLLDVPLVDLLGAAREEVRVYGSGGFTTYPLDQMTAQLQHWAVEQRIPRVKIKVAESAGQMLERDVERIRLARQVVGPDVELYVDANGGYTVKQAVRVLRETADARVSWLEEPVSSDDLAGLRLVRERVDADVTAGEYGTDVVYFERMCAAGAVDCLQIDATRCGGYTEWIRAAAVAAAHGLEVSAHCAPNLHAPVAAATANLRHIEWFHDHVRIEEMLFEGALDPVGGTVCPDRSRTGHGLCLKTDIAARYRTA